MVLGLIDFLLGGKKKTKVARNAQVATSSNAGSVAVQQQQPAATNVPDGAQNPTSNVNSSSEMQFEDTKKVQPAQKAQVAQTQPNGVQRKSVSEALSKLHSELKETNTRITEMVSSIKSVENNVNSLGHRVDELEASKKETAEKMTQIDSNMAKFLSLYELINNQYNPFVDQEEAKKVAVLSDGSSDSETVSAAIESLPSAIPKAETKTSAEDLESSLLELDTLNIEEAAGNAVPLTKLKNNTNSLVIILSWLEYLIKKVGIEETRNSLRYYTEVLRWTTPEVYFDLDKYLRGMKDKKNLEDGVSLGVRDHIVSLYFISKLNEKALDEKLTKAVLQIIKN